MLIYISSSACRVQTCPKAGKKRKLDSPPETPNKKAKHEKSSEDMSNDLKRSSDADVMTRRKNGLVNGLKESAPNPESPGARSNVRKRAKMTEKISPRSKNNKRDHSSDSRNCLDSNSRDKDSLNQISRSMSPSDESDDEDSVDEDTKTIRETERALRSLSGDFDETSPFDSYGGWFKKDEGGKRSREKHRKERGTTVRHTCMDKKKDKSVDVVDGDGIVDLQKAINSTVTVESNVDNMKLDDKSKDSDSDDSAFVNDDGGVVATPMDDVENLLKIEQQCANIQSRVDEPNAEEPEEQIVEAEEETGKTGEECELKEERIPIVQSDEVGEVDVTPADVEKQLEQIEFVASTVEQGVAENENEGNNNAPDSVKIEQEAEPMETTHVEIVEQVVSTSPPHVEIQMAGLVEPVFQPVVSLPLTIDPQIHVLEMQPQPVSEPQPVSQILIVPQTSVVEQLSQVVDPQVMTSPQVMTPQSQVFTPQSQVLNPQSQVLTPQSQVMTPQSQVMTPQSQVMSPQVMSPQSQVMTPQSQVMTPQTQVMSPQVLTPQTHMLESQTQIVEQQHIVEQQQQQILEAQPQITQAHLIETQPHIVQLPETVSVPQQMLVAPQVTQVQMVALPQVSQTFTLPQMTQLQHMVAVSHMMPQAMGMAQTLPQGVSVAQTLPQGVSMAQTLQQGVSVTQTLQQALPPGVSVPQSIPQGVQTIPQAVMSQVTIPQSIQHLTMAQPAPNPSFTASLPQVSLAQAHVPQVSLSPAQMTLTASLPHISQAQSMAHTPVAFSESVAHSVSHVSLAPSISQMSLAQSVPEVTMTQCIQDISLASSIPMSIPNVCMTPTVPQVTVPISQISQMAGGVGPQIPKSSHPLHQTSTQPLELMTQQQQPDRMGSVNEQDRVTSCGAENNNDDENNNEEPAYTVLAEWSNSVDGSDSEQGNDRMTSSSSGCSGKMKSWDKQLRPNKKKGVVPVTDSLRGRVGRHLTNFWFDLGIFMVKNKEFEL
jgi:hypothetical protein